MCLCYVYKADPYVVNYANYLVSTKELVDTTKFDIVEKKETKIARLKQELEESEIEWQAFDAAAKRYAVNLLEVEEEIKEIKQELAELENEPKDEVK